MDSPQPAPQSPPRRRRRWRIALMVSLVAVAALFAAMPRLLGLPVARRLLKDRANAILAPASVDFAALHLNWFAPTEIRGVVLRDKDGASVLVSDRAEFGWSLWQILFARPRGATLSFPGGMLDIRRLEDGTINLYEALEPILRGKPQRRLTIKIDGGRLRFRDLALLEPVAADRADILLDIAADPGPVTWTIALSRATRDGKTGRLDIDGSHTRPGDDEFGEGDTTIAIKASEWPWAVSVAGVEARGNLDATLDAARKSGNAVCSGSATIHDLWAGDAFRLDTARLDWNVNGGDTLWVARRLELSVPLASIASNAKHAGPDGSPDGGWLDGDLKLSVNGRYAPPSDQLVLQGLDLATPYGRLGASGRVDDVTASTPRIDLKGSLEPDWSRVQEALEREVEPNARIAGRSRGWSLAGPIARSGDRPLVGLRGELGLLIDALDIYGMRLAATELVVRTEGGKVGIDPIEARLNEGRLHIEPQWVEGRDGSVRIVLGAATTLENAVVNDEVSHRILSYAAPVLDGATRVQGRVSIKRVDAEFPLFAAGDARARVEGDVLFDDVRFMPGPLADELISLLPNAKADEDRPLLTLRDPISLRVAEGKVYQRGLKFPLTRLGEVALEGSVDFHKNLDLLARFTLNPPQAGDKPVLASILRAAKLEVPITGTLQDPRIDPKAMQERLKAAGSDLLENSVGIGAEGMMRILQGIAERRQARLADPNRPPPMTQEDRRELREERRRERLEKKAERRLQRSGE